MMTGIKVPILVPAMIEGDETHIQPAPNIHTSGIAPQQNLWKRTELTSPFS